jgi:hypothetical protein
MVVFPSELLVEPTADDPGIDFFPTGIIHYHSTLIADLVSYKFRVNSFEG